MLSRIIIFIYIVLLISCVSRNYHPEEKFCETHNSCRAMDEQNAADKQANFVQAQRRQDLTIADYSTPGEQVNVSEDKNCRGFYLKDEIFITVFCDSVHNYKRVMVRVGCKVNHMVGVVVPLKMKTITWIQGKRQGEFNTDLEGRLYFISDDKNKFDLNSLKLKYKNYEGHINSASFTWSIPAEECSNP